MKMIKNNAIKSGFTGVLLLASSAVMAGPAHYQIEPVEYLNQWHIYRNDR